MLSETQEMCDGGEGVWRGGVQLHQSGGLCVGWRARSLWSCVWRAFFVVTLELSHLRLQLKAHADFVSTGIEVLPVDQG